MTTRVTIPKYYLGEEPRDVDVKLVPVQDITGIQSWQVYAWQASTGEVLIGTLQRLARIRTRTSAKFNGGKLESLSERKVAETKWRAYGTPPSAWATKRVEVLAKMLRAARPAGV